MGIIVEICKFKTKLQRKSVLKKMEAMVESKHINHVNTD